MGLSLGSPPAPRFTGRSGRKRPGSRDPRETGLARTVHSRPAPLMSRHFGALLALSLVFATANSRANEHPARLAIGVGAMADRTRSRGEALGPQLRDAILAELRAARVEIVPPRPRPRAARRRHVDHYFLEGAISDVRTQRVGRGLRVRCSISLMVLDRNRDVRVVLSSAASAELSRAAAGSEAGLRSRALQGAVHGVLGRLLRTLSSAGASS